MEESREKRINRIFASSIDEAVFTFLHVMGSRINGKDGKIDDDLHIKWQGEVAVGLQVFNN